MNFFIISGKTKGFKISDDTREITTDLEHFRNKFKKNLTKSYPLILMEKLTIQLLFVKMGVLITPWR